MTRLVPELNHHVRDLDILLGLVLGGHLEDDVFLVLGHGLLADMLDKLAHPVSMLALFGFFEYQAETYVRGRRSLTLDGG